MGLKLGEIAQNRYFFLGDGFPKRIILDDDIDNDVEFCERQILRRIVPKMLNCDNDVELMLNCENDVDVSECRI